VREPCSPAFSLQTWARKPLGLSQGRNSPLPLELCVCQTAERHRDQQPVRTTCTDQRTPPAQQEQALAGRVRGCRARDPAGLPERRAAGQQGGGSRTAASQRAQLPRRKAVRPRTSAPGRPQCGTRCARAGIGRFFRRSSAASRPARPARPARHRAIPASRAPRAPTRAHPRPRAPTRAHPRPRVPLFPSKRLGKGATRDNGFLVLSTIGRRALRWSGPLPGTPKPVTISQEAAGW
jgi:hypothetical protein